ncbi:hypothetical protein [Candidatus Cyanaurora vandensis]|uniref:hypothetical protein n=1 Tax=Candidatus Cyanaurora vandensis TaxID=2714958 RepID=UPI00257BB645|nr:hypothetical protein [Candidatus Cyanaurora vandensis]
MDDDVSPRPTAVPLYVYTQLAQELDYLRLQNRALRQENHQLQTQLAAASKPKGRGWLNWAVKREA